MKTRFALGVLLPLALGACGRPPAAQSPDKLPAVRVSVASVQSESAPILMPINGTVRAVHRAALAAKVAGAVEAPPLTLGQVVRTGDVLLKISAGRKRAAKNAG